MDIFAVLKERFPSLYAERNFSFPEHTTIGVGGTAEFAAYPETGEQAAELLSFLFRTGIPYCFMGAGANVLPADGRFEGGVIRFSRMNALFAEENLLYAGAGVTGGALCRYARALDLSGFEPFTGIPMTVGGGITMNAGVAEGHFSDVAERVVAIEKGKIKIIPRKECGFSEKTSVFQSGIAVIGAYLRGIESFPDAIAQRTCYFRLKRANLPHGRSMGCVFVNPPNRSAGKLIDECGLKGISVGSARISEEHANFIINEGGASASDIEALIEIVEQTVRKKKGITLCEEIKRLPPCGRT